MKHFLSLVSILVLGVGLWVGVQGHLAVLTVAFLGFCVLLFVANLDRIAEFKASGGGFEAKTRDVIAKAESTLTELQMLATQVGALTLSLVKRSDRLGGYTDDEQAKIRQRMLAVLEQLGIRESEHPELLDEWHRFTEFDYAYGILGNSQLPNGASQEVAAEWKAMRSIESIPTPTEISDFLNRNSFMTPERAALLEDYEHYRAHRTHRRPDIWKDRQHWGRLG